MILRTKNITHLNIKAFSRISCEVGKLPRYVPNHKLSWLSSTDIRSRFIEYFLKSDHRYIKSCALNSNNVGSYFVNSGVSQFKEHILGHDNLFAGVSRAVNSQRCVRLGGKDCDLANIGYDSSHLSYFEMLGNWSFGGYDKKEACQLMWRFLTEELRLPPTHLYVTYFGGSDKLGLPPDYETRDIWFNLGVKDSKVLEFGEEHNFWEMGSDRSSNPLCGPSTEIHWDYLATLGDSADPRCARCFVNSASSEVCELWNCVFMEYRWANGGRTLHKLPSLIIDTGMGLERLSSVLQGVSGVFDTDLFKGIIDHLSALSKCSPYAGTFSLDQVSPISARLHTELAEGSDNRLRRDVAYRTITDHLRALTVCVNDNILPGRQNESLKVRQLLQRAIRQSKIGLGMSGGLSKVIDTVCESFSGWQDIDPLIRQRLKVIVDKEESSFLSKVDAYEKSFDNFIKQRDPQNNVLNEEEIYSLMSGKYGEHLSLDMIRAISRDAGLKVSENVLIDRESIERPNNKSINLSGRDFFLNTNLSITDNKPTYNYAFNPTINMYEVVDLHTSVTGLILMSSLDNISFIDDTSSDNDITEFGLLTEQTNMFATKGGQDCDKGCVLRASDNVVIAVVDSVTELDNGHIIHWCKLTESSASVQVSDKIVLRVDRDQRTGTTLHHTAHHIVFAVLNKLLGRVNQASSSVKFDHAKMGFSIDIALGDTQRLSSLDLAERLERLCLEIIKNRVPVEKKEKVQFSQIAQDNSVRYLKSENLPNEVRIVSILDSSEVCCGTHADNTGHLQDIIITSLKSTNQAIVELSFVVGHDAVEIREKDKILKKLCKKIDERTFVSREEIDDTVKTLNNALGCEVMSKVAREMVIRTVNTAAKLKIESPGISEVLSNMSNLQGGQTIKVNITSTKKAVMKILELKFSTPLIIYDKKKVIIFSLQNNLCDYIRESLPELVSKCGCSITDIVVETPKVRNINSDVLSQFVSISLPDTFEDLDGFVSNLISLIK